MGHHVVGIEESGLTDGSTPTVEQRATRLSTTFTSSDRIAVPPHAVEILRDCINSRRAEPGVDEKIREALALICREARRSEAMPEHLLVTLKELCHSLPEYERIPGAIEREVFLNSLVTTAIEEYYKAR